jgi:hypothetical protein
MSAAGPGLDAVVEAGEKAVEISPHSLQILRWSCQLFQVQRESDFPEEEIDQMTIMTLEK